MSVLVGRQAPDFKAMALMPDKSFQEISLSDYKGKYVLLFFYPLDFTFVCPTELHAMQDQLAEFEKRGVQVLGISVDSHFTHLAWVNQPKHQGGIEGTSFPLISDLSKVITQDYDVEVPDSSFSFRGVFLINQEGIVQYQAIHNTDIGRNVDELLRVVDALQFTERFGEVCPANWKAGDKGFKPDDAGLKEFLKQ